MLRRGAFLLCVCMLLRGAAELFSDATPASGIEFQHANSPTANKYLIETMSGGVALLDYDGDNLLDIFFTNGARLQDPMPRGAKPDKTAAAYWNRLYRNQGNGRFEDVTDSAGVRGPASSYSMGAAVGDYDNDGDADLYVTAYGGNTMYRNNGDGTFTDVTDDSGTGGSGWSTSAGFFDYNHDGKLDLFVGRYLEWSFEKNIFCGDRREGGHRAYCHPNNFQGVPNLLYRNDGGGKFTEVAVRAGVADGAGKALGVAFADYDNDGWQDIYVANDSVPCFLYRNKRDGTFEDVSLSSGAGLTDDGKTFAGMGVDFSDYDNDGLADIFVTDLSNEMYVLYRNTGDGFFSYETQRSGVGKATMLYSG
ncbi:MAG TPA: VCBS repeat-containing protein, partial [Bryobacteraceae bacterium]|nr:VCBS repeat-containing protein [Bryobacteraceae bacterium]